MENKFVKIGKIQSAQGIRGEIFVLLFAGEAAWLEQLKTLHLGESSPHLQIEVEKKRLHRKSQKVGLVLKLAGIKDRNAAEELVGQLVFIPAEFLVSNEGENIYLREILNFTVVDKQRGEVGRVVDFGDNGVQDILIVKNTEGKKSEVPLVEPILEKIDFHEQKVFMDIPQGLIVGDVE